MSADNLSDSRVGRSRLRNVAARYAYVFRLVVEIFITRRDNSPTMLRIVRLMSFFNTSSGLGNSFVSLLHRRLRRRFGCFVSPGAVVGRNCSFPHPVGIVIGEGVRIGDDCTIYQNVTLGARRVSEGEQGLYPELGKGAVIFAGAVVIGPIKIGADARIGANAVVITDVPDGATAIGVPAVVRNRAASPGTTRIAEQS